MAPRMDYPVREILYQLSPYQQNILGQAFVNAPNTFVQFMSTKGRGYLTTAVFYFGGVWWAKNEMEKTKQHERF